jgi:hypothetical protein
MKGFFSAITLACLTQAVVAQNPLLTHAVPGAIAAGKTAEIVFFGKNLAGAGEVWASFDARIELEPTQSPAVQSNSSPESLRCRLTVPGQSPVGIGAVRLATTNGISNLLLFMVDDLPSVPDNDKNKAVSTAQELKPPVAVDGCTDELGFKYYQFAARKGQRWSIEVVAQRLGSRCDPVVRVLDARGNELVYSDDEPGIGPDTRFSFTPPRTGEYVLELRDMNYQGGPEYHYRLRIGDFPIVSVPFPLGARRGTKMTFAFAGSAIERIKPVTVNVPEHSVRLPLAVKFPHGKGSALVTAETSDLPEVIESEPNELAQTATKIALPAAINGRFTQPKDRDYYEFAVEKNQRLVFRAKTRSLGSPCDLLMQLQNADGSRLADAAVTGSDEGGLTNRFKEAGTYRLLIEELTQQGGPALAYRIEIEPFQPGFALSLETDTIEATNSGTFSLKVSVARREYDGPIVLSLTGAAKSFPLEDNVIPEKKNEATLKVRVPPDLKSGAWLHFGLAGAARLGDEEKRVLASTLPALRKQFPNTPYPPPELDGLVALGIASTEPKPPDAKRGRKK